MARSKKSPEQVEKARQYQYDRYHAKYATPPPAPVTLAPVPADTGVQLDLVDYLWGLKLQRELNAQ
jgi:hypothetical protein